MPRNLDIHIVPEKPVTIEKYRDHQNTVRFQQIKRIPKDVGMRGLQLPLEKRTYRIIYRVPKAQQQVGPLPNFWYVVENLQALNFA
jgi:hypothetical protein